MALWRRQQIERLCTGALVLAEALQGFNRDRVCGQARKLLPSLEIVVLGGQEMAIQAARNFCGLRLMGVTVRKTIDTLIATRCNETDLTC